MRFAVLAMMATLTFGQSVEDAREQLRKARAANSEPAYLDSEKTLDRVIEREPLNATAVLYRGAAKMERAGWYAQNRKFGPANEVMAEACADMDRAVAMAPGNLDVRLMRGASYARFPRFLNKSDLAKQDLESILRHPGFATLAPAKQADVRALLASLEAAGGRPDRFPKIEAGMSPVIVAATVTMPPGNSVRWIVEAMSGSPGLLGTHVLTSVDKPGMIVILCWWKDKAAVNAWFYGAAHQAMIRQAYGDGKPGSARGNIEVTQVGIEVFAPLEGGTQVGGGLRPESLKAMP